MALASPAKAVNISAALTRLDPLGSDEYFIAFGPSDRQFCGTPNGYSATQLPPRVVSDLLGGQVKKVTWASFGGDHPSSYFFAYEMKDGSPGHRAGKAIPSTLRPFLDYTSQASFELASALRVQLGANRSWAAWAGSLWACRKVPSALQETLCQLSSGYHEDDNGIKGALKTGTLTNITWHANGSYYVKSSEHSWNFESDAIKRGWNDLWSGIQHAAQNEHADLAYVAINPHSITGDTFAFIMKTQTGREPDFVMKLEPDEAVFRLPSPVKPTQQPVEHRETRPEPAQERQAAPASSRHITNIAKPGGPPRAYRWAVSKRAGRSHPRDSWELCLKKGERLKVLEDMGNDWVLVENKSGAKGYAHVSWLNFQELRAHVDPRGAYACWTADVEKWLQVGTIRNFLSPRSYMDACTKETCKPLKQEGVGICVHDLHELLRGSEQYSLDFLRAQRNRYHPDKFARYCHPEHKEELKAKAEGLFVLFGVLMDVLENAPLGGDIA